MRHYELINEDTESHPNILAAITKDCQPFLSRLGGKLGDHPLYRGMNGDNALKGLTRKKVRLFDREPMSTARIKHERYNNYFEEMYGEPFRNSLFATGSIEQANYYGAVHAVFPIGEFSWLWSPIIEDMAIDIRWPSVGGFVNVPSSQKAVDDVLSRSQYQVDSNLKGAIESGHEIMIRCDEYYAISKKIFDGII